MTRSGTAQDFLREIDEQHGQAILAFATGLTRDRLLAEDVVQETMIRAWRNMDHFDHDKGSVRSWLFRVAQNVAIDKFRARKVRPIEVSDAVGEGAYEDHSDHVVLSDVIRQGLATLPGRHAAVLKECYLNDRTVSEAAKVLGIPLGTVKSRLTRAMHGMRVFITE